jgi:hypothetical protein
MANQVLLLRTGCLFKLVCSDCGKTIAKNIPSGHAAFANAGLVLQHGIECQGVKIGWLRQAWRASTAKVILKID